MWRGVGSPGVTWDQLSVRSLHRFLFEARSPLAAYQTYTVYKHHDRLCSLVKSGTRHFSTYACRDMLYLALSP